MPFKKYVTIRPSAITGNGRIILKTPQDTYGFLSVAGTTVRKHSSSAGARLYDNSATPSYTLVGYAHPNVIIGFSGTSICSFRTDYPEELNHMVPVSVAPIPALVSGMNQRKTSVLMKPYGGRSPLVVQYGTGSNLCTGFTLDVDEYGTWGSTWVRGGDFPGRNPAANFQGMEQGAIVDADGQCIFQSFDPTTSKWVLHQLQMTDTGYEYHGRVVLPGAEDSNTLLSLPFHTGKSDRTFGVLRNTGGSGAGVITSALSGGPHVGLYDLGPVPGGTADTNVSEIASWTPPSTDPIRGWTASDIFPTELNQGVYAAGLLSSAVVDGNSRSQATYFHNIFGSPESGSMYPALGADANSGPSAQIYSYFGKGFASFGSSYRGTLQAQRWYFHWTKGKIGRLRVYDGSTWRKA